MSLILVGDAEGDGLLGLIAVLVGGEDGEGVGGLGFVVGVRSPVEDWRRKRRRRCCWAREA